MDDPVTAETPRHRIGIVGAGDIARKVYFPLLGTDPGIEIVAVASRTRAKAEALAQRYRLPEVCDTVTEVLARRPDIVFVHAGTAAHAEIVGECLDAGVHVYVDKPLSEDLAEVERLTLRAADLGLLLAVGFNRRFAPMVRAAVDAVPAPTMIVAEKHRKSLQARPARETVHDDLIHVVDLAVWAGGLTAQGDVSAVVRSEGGRLLAAALTVTAPAGFAQVSMARDAGQDFERLFLAGDGVSATVDDLDTAVLRSAGSTQTRSFGSWDDILVRRGFSGVVGHVLESLEKPERCEVSAAAVLDTHRITDRIARAVV
ncbi:Gfo/Idh/MocA family oxidoreductase [Actinoplanes sp. NEAU-A12]|uniref:Gfo/Idh/MocA family oxidoreductase n=1 Tax=Actinoplanes sandaracinus TaxID=3045177 RepID=A0ABT6WBT4_9ACTN|nr:Gfo/Idh/MocA family oxidoreductase [Actinoplanes sandaracinus]MDI6097204.1 Gfo/Idh/MocA family oxidoreductase [Actinoplanes sandaracinus]